MQLSPPNLYASVDRPAMPPAAATSSSGPAEGDALSAIQLGLNWFPERAGGLDRYFYELLRALPQAGIECRGLVIGSSAVHAGSSGKVSAFAAPSASLLQRFKAVRSALRDAMLTDAPDIVVSHFALYSFPILRLIGRLPFVVHFHGPWAAESRAEGANALACLGKRQIERAVYARADRIVCLSEAFARILRGRGVDARAAQAAGAASV